MAKNTGLFLALVLLLALVGCGSSDQVAGNQEVAADAVVLKAPPWLQPTAGEWLSLSDEDVGVTFYPGSVGDTVAGCVLAGIRINGTANILAYVPKGDLPIFFPGSPPAWTWIAAQPLRN